MQASVFTLHDPVAVIATGTGAAQALPCGTKLGVIVNISAISGAGATLTPSVQWSNDGMNWADAATPDAFAALTATGVKAMAFDIKGAMCRLSWVVAGTSPSITFKSTGRAA